MIYLESHSMDPYFNLALEEFVFEKLDRNESYFMLWQNENTVVVGKYQNTAEEINQSYIQSHGIRVARRLSGGGAVYHDSGNLNYTFVVDQNDYAQFNFQQFVRPVIQALKRLGVEAEFNGRNDLTIDGRKFSGSAQYARHGRLLHHGCIMLNTNLTNVADALNPRMAKFESKSVKSVRSRVTTINAHAPSPISMDLFRSTLRSCLLESGDLKQKELTEEDLAEVERLRRDKYATWAWNYGRSPAYHMRREQKFEAGMVTVCLQAEEGRIQSIRFYGDFFGNGEISELETALTGVALDENLEKCLIERNVNHYLNGIPAGELARLIVG